MESMEWIVYLLIINLFLFASCADYMGKDDYVSIGAAEIGNINTTYNVEVGKYLEITPKLELNLIDSTNLEYQWLLDGEVISDSRELKHQFMVSGTYRLILNVINTQNGMTYVSDCSVIVNPRYARSWLVLSEENGKSVLSAIVFKKVSGGSTALPGVRDTLVYEGADYNIYEQISGEVLGNGPVKLVEHWVKDYQALGEVLVIQKSGPVELNGESLVKETDVKNEFLDGVYPEGFVCKDAWLTASMGYLLGEDNRMYYKVNDRDSAFQTGYYQMEPYLNGEKFLQITPNYYYALFRPPLVLRERDNKFAILVEREYNNMVGFGGTNGLLVDLLYMGGIENDFNHTNIEVLYTTATNGNRFLSVYRDTVENKCYVHQFLLNVSGNNATAMQVGSQYGKKEVDSYLFEDFVDMCVFPVTKRKLSIIASGNKLYWYQDKVSKPQYGLFHEFDHRIVSLSLKDFNSSSSVDAATYYGGPHLAVALDSGEVYILRINDTDPTIFDVIWQGGGFGNIKDVIYKYGTYNAVRNLEY